MLGIFISCISIIKWFLYESVSIHSFIHPKMFIWHLLCGQHSSSHCEGLKIKVPASMILTVSWRPQVPIIMLIMGIMLSDTSQAQKDKYCMITLICSIYNRIVKFIETEGRFVVTWDLGQERMGSCLMETKFQFCKMNRVLEISCVTVWTYLILLSCTLKMV